MDVIDHERQSNITQIFTKPRPLIILVQFVWGGGGGRYI
jgi:hypothetical protein